MRTLAYHLLLASGAALTAACTASRLTPYSQASTDVALVAASQNPEYRQIADGLNSVEKQLTELRAENVSPANPTGDFQLDLEDILTLAGAGLAGSVGGTFLRKKPSA